MKLITGWQLNRLLAVIISALLISFIMPMHIYGQGIEVIGKVISEEDGLGMTGVNVTLHNTTNGTITDRDGNFSIRVDGLNDVLDVSFIGYESQSISLGGRTTLEITLRQKFEELDEVIVIGYGVQKKSDLTGSVVKVSTEDIQNLPVTNAADVLKGRAAGVMVNSNSGMPGRGPSILVRGESSISSTNAPLVIIDGAPNGDLATLNYNDIESFEILKDAAASAIYGSRGANGVILITTKRGGQGKSNIQFSAKYGTRHFPGFYDMMNSEEFYSYIKEVFPVTDPPFSNSYTALYESVSQGTIDTVNMVDMDWQKEMFDIGSFQEYALSFSNGSENFSYLISGSYLKDKGIIKPAVYDRYTFRTNLDGRINKRVTISANAYYAYTYRQNVTDAGLGWNQGVVNACLQYPPFLPIYDEVTGNFFPNPIRPNIDSPYALANGKWNDRYGNDLNGNFKFNFEILKGFTFRSEWFANFGFNSSRQFSDRINTYIGRDRNGLGSDSKNYSIGTTIQNLLDYRKSFGNHELYILAGQISEHWRSQSLNTLGYDYSSDYIVLVKNATQFEPPNDNLGEGRHYAVISRLNYSYNNRYILQLNFRADGSDNFAKGNKWGYFPSASMGWKISEEDFMSGASNIDLLKMRFGLGQTGNDAIGFAYLSTYGSSSRSKYPIFGDDSPIAYYTRGLANPNLKWEETFEVNLGLDLTAFRGRISASLDLYSRDSYDLLYNKPVPITTGSRSVAANLGQVNNKGVELQITTHNISNSRFSWLTDFNFGYNKNKVKELGEDVEADKSGFNWIIAGYERGAFFGYQVERILQEEDFENGQLKEDLPIQIGAKPGDIKWVNHLDTEDINGDGNVDAAITQEDRVYLGNPRPPFMYGMNNTLTYKNLTFSFFLQGVAGNTIYNQTRTFIEGMNDWFNQSKVVLDRWTPANTDTDIPRATGEDDLNENSRDSDRWLEPGGYLRVKDITLSYRLPEVLTSKMGMSSSFVYVTAQNWITITKYSGYDPELAPTDNGNYPNVKTIIVGLNLMF